MLKYRILWFDDSQSFIDSLSPRIIRYIEDLGFKPEIISKTDDSNVQNLLREIDDFNLILMDYNLNSKTTGKEIIKKIRNNDIYTEVVFYSGQQNVIPYAKSEAFDGVFYSEKDQLYEKTIAVVNLTVKKNQDINNIRGLVIAESIEIEVKIEKVIISYFDFDDEKLEVFQSIFDGRSEVVQAKKKCDLINKISKERITTLNNTLKSGDIDTSVRDGIRDKIKFIEQFKDLAKDIETDVIEIRNVLAHTQESPDLKNTLISRINKHATTITIDDEWCKSTRKKLKRHSENLDSALARLK